MTKRKKILKKGISSLEDQIRFHQDKMNLAKKEEDLDLEDYYKREIDGLKKTKDRKEKQLDKQ